MSYAAALLIGFVCAAIPLGSWIYRLRSIVDAWENQCDHFYDRWREEREKRTAIRDRLLTTSIRLNWPADRDPRALAFTRAVDQAKERIITTLVRRGHIHIRAGYDTRPEERARIEVTTLAPPDAEDTTEMISLRDYIVREHIDNPNLK